MLALEHIPQGSFTLSKRPKAFPSGVWRQTYRGDGPWLIDTANQKRLDWMCALGALTVGHNHPHVVEAVTKQVRDGAIFSLPHRLEASVAERLGEVIPCAEQVRVVKTGSEACSAAVRIARLATGRTLVLTTPTSYHGWHDALIVAKPNHPGVPDVHPATIAPCDFYNNLRKLEDFLYMRGIGEECDRVAAVMFEPVQGEPPQPKFLQTVVDMAHKHGAVVIFDEMLCGGRLRVGGAQELYGVTPDLATFGKAFGGGLPFAFVCGREELMRHAWPISGTFSGDALALAAADAMLDLYEEELIIPKLWRNGSLVMEAMMQVAARHDLACVFHGHPPRFWFEFPKSVDQRIAKSVFVQQAAKLDQLVHPNVIFASAAMTTEVAMEGAALLAEAFDITCEAIKDDTLTGKLVGAPYEDSVR